MSETAKEIPRHRLVHGDWIRWYMLANRINSAIEVADHLECDPSTVCRLRARAGHNARPLMYRRIMALVDVSSETRYFDGPPMVLPQGPPNGP